MQCIFKQHNTTRQPICHYPATIQHNGRGIENFTQEVSSDITKKTQAHNTAQEHTGKVIENAVSQALTKAQDTVTPSFPRVDLIFEE